MPRRPRLDAFRTSSGIFDRPLHHVMRGGIERRPRAAVWGSPRKPPTRRWHGAAQPRMSGRASSKA